MALTVGITRMEYEEGQGDAIRADLEGRILDEHKKQKREGLRDAFFVMNEESREAIGIAIWDSEQKLKQVEREPRRGPRRADEAPTDYTKLRDRAIEEHGGQNQVSDWYELVSRV
jgi:hypothetical protein